MDTESGSNSVNVGDEQNRDSNKPVPPKRDGAAHNKPHDRQAARARKMSAMPEEEDVASDDTDPDVIRIGHHQREKRGEAEAEWSTEERGRLLSPAARRILVAPATSSNNFRRTIDRDDSPDRCPARWQQSRLAEQSESRSSPSRDNGTQSPGRLVAGARHHHRCPCLRSLRPAAVVMDECQQHCSCYHQPPSWASILYADVNGGQARSCPDAVSIRSLASIGLGSSDGRKLTIRRVPTSPSELLNMVHPPPFEDDLSTCTSYDDGDADDPSDYRQPRRPHWANKVQFVLACIGYSVGLGNVWRFPYLCYKSGGGVFLVPYFLILIVCGVPLLYMELSIGQFTRRGPIGALGQVCPLLKGAGLSSVVISFLLSTYHNVIIAYAIYYFFAAFRAEQPWSRCDNSWNSPRCWLPSYGSIDNRTRPNSTRTPSEEFFDNKVLQISNGIEEPGVLRWELVACLITAWIMVYFSIWKSIKSSAQVRYLTATLPFLLIVVFLTRSLTLEGAEKGLQFFFHPRWELLGDAKVWINAAAQVFNSVGIAFGSMICFASYNRFHNTILVDTVAVSLINAFSSLLVGIFSFATIGNIALEQNTSVEDVLTDGPGLVFVIYPQALVKMPASQLWAVLFFFMLVCLSLNSQFAVVEVVVTSIQDGFPNWVKRHLLCHEILVLLICVVSFLFGLPNITQGGIYFFQLIDHYAASMSIMFLAFFEIIAISWLYGVRRLCNNVKEMTGRLPSVYFRFCWFLAAPLLIMAVWVFSLIDYEPPTYHNGDYIYPWWAEAIGWGIASLSLICIPAFAVCVLARADGITFAERLKNSIKPHFEACKVCGQEYCIEPMHNLEEDVQKESQVDMNTSIPLNSHYLLKPQM
ncbi:sodium- and chloride-dependent GABA transporter ine isoform X1 [Harpegnathos saltator]|nr:sodium- and chloride-dependent GABA transporter ine isoform X1 [Harpegnathos saltator]XP_011138637.1 sodium- and chloride-dependent GABA transporter ine isoform X1 [Harpegnathos saltator]XP_011138638.1 sodium- and chloride-dependent GABA transporter ine isoform X1 [Harpegnathos saltator]XP_019696726.1 sodium- and chloride-dependent GABA transporter ine isoform X1 [Harpegnathos saltator]XP_025163788.1 sodium- and chloride-dependent GABA transporter ine isoform X1 [Harpegnathos saltator]XP_02